MSLFFYSPYFVFILSSLFPIGRDSNSRKTVFVLGVAYLQYRMYDSADPEAQPIAVCKETILFGQLKNSIK